MLHAPIHFTQSIKNIYILRLYILEHEAFTVVDLIERQDRYGIDKDEMNSKFNLILY